MKQSRHTVKDDVRDLEFHLALVEHRFNELKAALLALSDKLRLLGHSVEQLELWDSQP